MNFPINPKRVIAIIEKSSGGDEIGDMWLETRTFNINQPIIKILSWAAQKNCTGRLIISIDDNTETEIPELKEKEKEIKTVPPAGENTEQQENPQNKEKSVSDLNFGRVKRDGTREGIVSNPQNQNEGEPPLYIPSIEEVEKLANNPINNMLKNH